jgi:cytoskeletal protein RodZ
VITGLELRLIGIAALVLTLLGGYAWWHHHVTQQAREAAQAEQHEADARQAAANQAARDAQAQTQREAADEATRIDTARAAGARALDVGVQRLHDAARTVRPAAAGSATAACASTPASVPGSACVSTDLYLRAVDVARDLAEYADCLRTGGQLCVTDYDALTKGSP